MDNKKTNNALIVFLIIIILIMAIIIGLLFTGTINLKSKTGNKDSNITNNENSNNSNEVVTYNYTDIKGLYKGSYEFTSEELAQDESNKVSANYFLHLYENGTFTYRMSIVVPMGYNGNYTIVGNKIMLNYLFKTGNDTGLVVTNGTKELLINSDLSIHDSDPFSTHKEISKIKEIELVKATPTEEKDYTYDFSNVLENGDLVNNQTSYNGN
ncbi:MAG: hypothetical protein IKF19_02295 [Bacilli bacterium]|nr:hypothetical protein [Bacilli bacterium]